MKPLFFFSDSKKDTELTTKKFPKLAETFSIALVAIDLKKYVKF